MADSTLTALPAATTLTGPELVYGVQSGGNVKITAAQIQTFVLGNSFLQFSGPTTSPKIFALPDASATILTTNAAVTVLQGGTGAATLLAHGILLGNGTSAIAVLAVGATGTLLAGATGADPAFSATPTLGANGGTGGAITFNGSTSGSVAVQVAAAAGTGTVFQLPASNGTNGYVLQTDGSGITSWVAASGGGSPGGSSLTLQYNNASSFGGMSGTSWDDTNRSLTITGATVTASKPVFDLSQTWNNSGVTFTGLKLNVTRTAAASASKLVDLQIGGSSQFTVAYDVADTGGAIISGDGSNAKLTLSDNLGSVLAYGANTLKVGAGITSISTAQTLLTSSSASLVFNNTATTLFQETANYSLCLGNSTHANSFKVYNTTDAGGGSAPTNYERGIFDWQATSNLLTIGTQKGGTGTVRDFAIIKGTDTFFTSVVVAVASLPAASSTLQGSRRTVNNATATTYLSIVAGGGANVVPVFCDGTNWLIG